MCVPAIRVPWMSPGYQVLLEFRNEGGVLKCTGSGNTGLENRQGLDKENIDGVWTGKIQSCCFGAEVQVPTRSAHNAHCSQAIKKVEWRSEGPIFVL